MAEAAGAAVPEPLLRGLPDEIVMWEILLRLPPKALLRCRAVCPAWRRATSTRDFLLAHHARQPTFPLLHAYTDGICIDIVPFDHRAGLTTVDQLLQQSIARFGDAFYYMEASCDGLLVLSIYNYIFFDTHFFICNPATRQYAPLPMLLGFTLLGMYRHNPTGEYRLLMNKRTDLKHDEGLPIAKYAFHVFTIGSGKPPRRIGYPDDAGRLTYTRVSLLLHGSLHWHKGKMITVFDTTAESFRQMRSPVVSVYDDARLFEIGGMLGMSILNDGATIMDIWVMQDYEAEVWSFKHRVELPIAQFKVQFGGLHNRDTVVVPSADGDVFVLIRFGDTLLQVDTDGKLVASLYHRGISLFEVRLKQTLVPHNFFPALEGYVVNASPFM